MSPTGPSNPQPQPSRRDAIVYGAFGLLGFGAAAAGIAHLARESEARQTAFLDELRREPLSGKIAYACGTQVKVLSAAALPDSNAPEAAFQLPHAAIALAWRGKSELLVVAQARSQNPGGTPHDPALKHNFTIVSHGLFKLSLETGKTSVLFDPYGASAIPLFGDISAKDGATERRFEDEFNSSDKKSRIVFGDHSSFKISNVATAASSSLVYFESGGKWYQLEGDGSRLELCARIPADLRTNHQDTGNRDLQFHQRGGLLESNQVVIKRVGVEGVALEKGSYAAAYRSEP